MNHLDSPGSTNVTEDNTSNSSEVSLDSHHPIIVDDWKHYKWLALIDVVKT